MGQEPADSRPPSHPTLVDAKAEPRARVLDGLVGSSSEPPRAMPLGRGTMVDHFQITRLIGRGGMGEVYLAFDTKLGRRVALKMVPSELFASEATRERFQFEARTTARFNHPHIVTLHAVGEHEGRTYLALEYVEGQDLSARMAEQRLSLPEALRIGLATVEALVEAHEHGVLHRDLKPGNVLIGRDGRVRVLDFGLAKVVPTEPAPPSSARGGEQDPHGPPSTRSESDDSWGAGTPRFMAPEQWRGAPCTRATDMWAFGVLCFVMLAGRAPYLQEDMAELALAVCNEGEPAPRLDADAAVPAELALLVAGCLEKDPERRPTAAEAVSVMRGLLASGRPVADDSLSPFRGLLPFTQRHAHLFFGRDAEVASFAERLRLQPVLPVVGPSGAGKSSFVKAGVIPRLLEQEPWTVLELRPGARPFYALVARLLDVEGDPNALSSRLARTVDSPVASARQAAAEGRSSPEDAQLRRPEALRDDDTLRTVEHSSTEQELNDPAEEAAVPAVERDEGHAKPEETSPASAAEPPSQPSATATALSAETLPELAEELEQEPHKLALELRAIAAERRTKVLLFVDQLEELFTLAGPEDSAAARRRRRAFVEALASAADDPHDPVRVIFTVRDDFLGRLAISPHARDAISQVTVIQRPDEAALRDMLIKPVEALQYHYEDPELIDELCAGVGAQAGSLPVLQFAANRLWEHRDTKRRLLLRSAYEQMGGVEGALARHADGVLAGFSTVETRLARTVLLRLVTPEQTRRMVSPARALEGLGDEGRHVLRRLTEARLVAVTKMHGDLTARIMIELAHESLIHDWTTLSRWIAESREEISFLADVEQAAALWDKRGRQSDELWRGNALSEALRTVERCTAPIPRVATAFLEASDQRAQAGRRRRRLLLAAAFGVLGAAAVVASLLAIFVSEQRNLAELRRGEALREGARAAFGQGNMLEARAKLRVALELQDSTAARALWWQLSSDPLVWQLRFGVPLYSVAWSPDGRLIATAGQDGAIYLADPTTRALQVLRGHTDQVLALAFSPDGQLLASSCLDQTVRLWDLSTGRGLRTLAGHGSGVFSASFSPDGRLLAAGGYDRTVRIWEVSSGKPRSVLEGHEAAVRGVSFGPRGRRLASGSSDKTVRVWDVASGRVEHVLEGHEKGVIGVSFSPDGKRIASASYDRTIILWDPEAGAARQTLAGHTAGVGILAFSPDGKRLGSASSDKTARLWHVDSGELVRTLEHEAQVWSLSFAPDGRRLATASGGKRLRVWDLDVAARQQSHAGHGAPVMEVAFSPDGSRLASAGYDRTVRIWETRSGRQLMVLAGHDAEATSVSYHPDGTMLASGSIDRSIRLWDAVAGTELQVLAGHQSEVFDVTFSHDGSSLASSSFDQTIRIWDIDDGSTRRVLSGHTDRVWDVDFSPDDKLLASASYDRTARLWDLASNDPPQVLQGHTDRVYGVSFHPNGLQLATGSYDQTVRLWDLATGDSTELGRHPSRAYLLDYHPDGVHLGVACADGSGRIWDTAARSSIPLEGHHNEVNSVKFSPDGTLAATASDDGTVRVWGAKTGRPYWHAPALLGSPPRLWSHRGWQALDSSQADEPQAGQWRTAVEQRARYATESPDRQLLCIQTHERQVELWTLAEDRLVVAPELAGVAQVVASPLGCLARTSEEVLFVARSGSLYRLELEGAPTAIGWGDGSALAAAGPTLHVWRPGADGAPADPATGHREVPVGLGVTAVALHQGWLLVGFRDGNIERHPAGPSQPDASLSFEQVPASPVLRIVPGPSGTVLAGYASGALGLWAERDGSRLAHTKLHGPVVHLHIDGHRLHAATELASHLMWELDPFYADHCALLREVWQQVPVSWHGGRPVVKPKAPDHPCHP